MSIDVEVNRAEDLDDDSEDQAIDDSIEAAIEATLLDRGVADAAVSATLMGDQAIAGLNLQYLGHEGPTDVITFPLYESGERPVGDIYIGLEQARRQAAELGVPLEQEIARLAVHGTLHVLGYDHPHEQREESELWQLQESILARLIQS